MQITQARLIPYRLPLKRPWVAAATVLHERCGMLIALTSADGITGWGDCAPLPSSAETVQARIFEALAALSQYLPGKDAGQALEESRSLAFPELRWTLETALCDAAARRQGISLAEHLGGIGVKAIQVNAALGALSDGSAEEAAVALAQGYRYAKIKVGINSVDNELAGLRAVHKATGGRLRLRLDANRAFADADAWRFLDGVASLAVEAVEEPLSQPTLERLATLQAASPFAIAVDESLSELGAAALMNAQAVRRLVVKPARIGGIAATRRLIGQAHAAGIEVVLTSVVDSAVGVTAAAHLAAALAPELAHGLATSAWLAADVAQPLPLVGGKLLLGDSPGLGLTLHREFA